MNPDGSEQVIEDTGIYKRVRMPISVALSKDGLGQIGTNLDSLPNLRRELSEMLKREAVAVLATGDGLSALAAAPHGRFVLNGNDAIVIRSDASDAIKRAADALQAIGRLYADMGRNDLRAAVNQAIEVGRLLEKLLITPHEPDAARGKKTKRAAKAGFEAVHGSSHERRERNARWQAELEKRMSQNSHLSYSAACAGVADRSGVSGKTVWRNTNNPRK